MTVHKKRVYSVFDIQLKISSKVYVYTIFTISIFAAWIFFLDARLLSKLNKTLNNTSEKMKMKTILYWTNMFDSKTFFSGEGEIFKHCDISACQTTTDRNFTKIEDFDAILFHGVEVNISDLPMARSTKQKYIFVDLESPMNWPLDPDSIMNDFYNWTMSYRRDSDIFWPYAYIFNSLTNDIVYPIWAEPSTVAHPKYDYLHSSVNLTILKGKRKSVAWFLSHCNTTGLRDSYVAELQKYIDVDIYGYCGNLSCSLDDKVKCYKMLESRYYFYLSFENSVCQEYVTEKLFNVMPYNIVPIVYGGANYTEFVPPGSYINVVDFNSPKHLAKYLRYLMNDLEEYATYFWWKKYFFVDPRHDISLCQMCKMLHDEKSLASSNIPDLKKWRSEGKCQNPEKFLKKITRY